MQDYRVSGGVFRAGKGMMLRLTAAQAEPRRNRLETATAGDVYRATDVLEFKAGEVVGLIPSMVPKNMLGVLEPLGGAAEAAARHGRRRAPAPASIEKGEGGDANA